MLIQSRTLRRSIRRTAGQAERAFAGLLFILLGFVFGALPFVVSAMPNSTAVSCLMLAVGCVVSGVVVFFGE